ncbi:MAG: HDOD domain-containing protein [Acidimicrobiales bacterium]
MISLLFVDDEPEILAGLRRMLRAHRFEWDMWFADGADAGLVLLAEHQFDVVVTDMRMPGTDGAELLACVRRLQPSAVRIVLSGHADESSAQRSLPVAHQFLSKPCEPDRLQAVITHALELRSQLRDVSLLELVGSVSALPSPSASVVQLQALLAEPDADPDRVADVVASDVAMSSKLLQVVNSAFYGLSRSVDDPAEAVRLLGAPVVGEIVLCNELLDGFRARRLDRDAEERLRLVQAVSAARAQLALVIAIETGRSRGEQRRIWSEAFFADIGDVLFLGLDTTGTCEVDARTRRLAGAALLEIWGLPHHLVETVASADRVPGVAASEGHVVTWLAQQLLGEPEQRDPNVPAAFDRLRLPNDGGARLRDAVNQVRAGLVEAIA